MSLRDGRPLDREFLRDCGERGLRCGLRLAVAELARLVSAVISHSCGGHVGGGHHVVGNGHEIRVAFGE